MIDNVRILDSLKYQNMFYAGMLLGSCLSGGAIILINEILVIVLVLYIHFSKLLAQKSRKSINILACTSSNTHIITINFVAE